MWLCAAVDGWSESGDVDVDVDKDVDGDADLDLDAILGSRFSWLVFY